MKLRSAFRLAIISTAAFLAPLSASLSYAAETLLLSSWLPPQHPIVVDMIKPWIAAVDKGERK